MKMNKYLSMFSAATFAVMASSASATVPVLVERVAPNGEPFTYIDTDSRDGKGEVYGVTSRLSADYVHTGQIRVGNTYYAIFSDPSGDPLIAVPEVRRRPAR